MTASALAEELEVSVRTIYRDITSLNIAGVPVWAESGPGGGCQLVDGYRTPLASLSREEANALLTLAASAPLHELGLTPALESARQRVQDVSGLGSFDATVHLDLPRWFASDEHVPHLPALAEAVRDRHRVDLTYESNRRRRRHLALAPLGLVNKAGTWYVVVSRPGRTFALRVSRVTTVNSLDDTFERPENFDLSTYWAQWASEFEASRPRLGVVVRASPQALSDMVEVFGTAVATAVAQALPVGNDGWHELQLRFEHEAAAVARLAGFGDSIEVITPESVRDRLVETAASILRRYNRASDA